MSAALLQLLRYSFSSYLSIICIFSFVAMAVHKAVFLYRIPIYCNASTRSRTSQTTTTYELEGYLRSEQGSIVSHSGYENDRSD